MLMVRPRATKANALAALLALLLGFAVATQVRQNQTLPLESLRQGDLVNILDQATLASARLDSNARQLQVTRDQLVSGSNSAAAVKAAQERLDALAILAGTARAHGRGIRMTIADPNEKLTAPVLLDAIQELRDAGAEAIQVNNVRIVASSAFGLGGSGIEIDGKSVSAPYSISAIGDSATMASAMEIPGGLSENVRQLGATINVTQEKELTVGALHALTEPRYARPVPPSAPATP
ncbi:MAG: hypothetical protein QOE58_2474 [Actinomycetota bacterium]|jgi:uncharacterized protein YlxW (UPF0749 family)|nr:hypothetical protein [Actinomycetota bacterium]